MGICPKCGREHVDPVSYEKMDVLAASALGKALEAVYKELGDQHENVQVVFVARFLHDEGSGMVVQAMVKSREAFLEILNSALEREDQIKHIPDMPTTKVQ